MIKKEIAKEIGAIVSEAFKMGYETGKAEEREACAKLVIEKLYSEEEAEVALDLVAAICARGAT